MNFGKSLGLIVLLAIPTACQAVPASPVASSTVSTVAQNSPNPSITSEAQVWQTDVYLKDYAQTMLSKRIPIAEDGAMGENVRSPEQVQVLWQRDAFDVIAFGVSTGNRSVVERGISAFRWAFEHQGFDGSFGVSKYPEIVSFLGAYARSILFLQNAGLTSEAQKLSDYVPQMQKMLSNPNFLSEEKAWEKQEESNPLTNQLFWAAFCYHAIHLVQPTSRLEAQAKTWLNRGLARQRTDGTFPEKRGSDTSYQGVSLQFLNLYSLYSPEDRALIKPALHKGFTWLSSKVLPDGTIDVTENTRTAGNQERNPYGRFKQGHFGSPLPYIYWSYLGGGRDARLMAVRVYEAQRQQRRVIFLKG